LNRSSRSAAGFFAGAVAASALAIIPLATARPATTCAGRICKWDVRAVATLRIDAPNWTSNMKYMATFSKVPIELRKGFSGGYQQNGKQVGGVPKLTIFTRGLGKKLNARGFLVEEVSGERDKPDKICHLPTTSFRGVASFSVDGEILAKASPGGGPPGGGVVHVRTNPIDYDFPPVGDACTALSPGSNSEVTADRIVRRILVETGVDITFIFNRPEPVNKLNFPLDRLAAGKRFMLSYDWSEPPPFQKIASVRISFVRRA
jgi:hypothetical protein